MAPRVVAAIHSAIVQANPDAEIRFVDTTCQPTRQRQRSVEQLVPLVQAMVIVGGKNSNNTRELVDLCRQRGLKSFHVQDAADLNRDWFSGISCVGLTAGTSTLDSTIREVKQWLLRPGIGNGEPAGVCEPASRVGLASSAEFVSSENGNSISLK